MKNSLLLLLLLISSVSYSQWVIRAGGTGADQANDLSLDASGNIIVTGYFTGTAEFGTGGSAVTLTGSSGMDAFIAKYNSGGTLLWAIKLAGSGDDQGRSVKTDADGNIYVCGDFTGTVDFNPKGSAAEKTSAGLTDIFAAKYTSAGVLSWVYQAGGAGSDYGNCLTLDSDKNIYLASASGGMLLEKISSAGSQQWTKTVTGCTPMAVGIDASNNIYVTGYFTGSINFEPGTSTYAFTAPSPFQWTFLSQYSSSGTFGWAVQLDGEPYAGHIPAHPQGGSVTPFCIYVSPGGDVRVFGGFDGSVRLLPGGGASDFEGYSNGISGCMELSRSSDGFLHAGPIIHPPTAGSGTASTVSVAYDAAGNEYLTGYIGGAFCWNTDGGIHCPVSDGGIYVSRNRGSSWTITAGGMDAWGTTIKADGSGNIYVAGGFTDPVTFGSGETASTVTGAGQYDIFVAKIQASDGLLPVELSSFSASAGEKSVSIRWQTETEVNNFGFRIERSADKKEWSTIGYVPGCGSSNVRHEYSFTDKDPLPGVSWYRLRQTDTDGKFKYYEAVSIDMGYPAAFALKQNSPNPFNPSTSIRFDLPEKTHVSVKVYDLSGRETAVLLNDEKPAGSHIVFWNGRGRDGQQVSSGVYLYKLTAGTYSETRKMNLIR